MSRWIKLIVIILGFSALVGSITYGTVLAMYKLADALSLPPALKNLVPLAALVLLCFIASPSIRYFQNRAKNRTVEPSTTKSLLVLNHDQKRRQAWLQIKAKGKRRYVLRTGVLGWGLPVFAIFTPAMLIFGPGTHPMSLTEIVGLTIFSLLIWLVGGYFFCLWMWKTFDNKYR